MKLKRAERLMPFFRESLLTATDLTPDEQKARDLLLAWDFHATADSAATAVFFTTYREAVMLALKDEVDQHSFEFILSQRYSTNVADMWFERNDHVVWDDRGTPEKEKRNAQVCQSLPPSCSHAAKRSRRTILPLGVGANSTICTSSTCSAVGRRLPTSSTYPQTEVGGGMDSVWNPTSTW